MVMAVHRTDPVGPGPGRAAVRGARASRFPSGKPVGSTERRRHVADSLVPKGMCGRSVRGGDIRSLPPGVRAEAQKVWMGENGHGRRAAAGHMIGAPAFRHAGGPVAREIARRDITHSAGCP